MAEEYRADEITVEDTGPAEAGRKGGAVATAPAVSVRERSETLDWSAAVWAGIIAGVVFPMAEMAMIWLFMGESIWGPPRMMAAIVMGKGVLPPPATFDFGIVMVAMAVHFVLSILFALPAAWFAQRSGAGGAAAGGAAWGLVLYLVNFYVMTMAFPWFAMARNWVSITAHVIFGLTAALAYRGLAKPEPRHP